MRFADYDKMVSTQSELQKYKTYFEEYISRKQKELEEFLERGNKRLKNIEQWEKEKAYKILGSLHKDGKKKEVMLIIRYPDGTQKVERYKFDKISDARAKLKELREIRSGVDWSAFEEEI